MAEKKEADRPEFSKTASRQPVRAASTGKAGPKSSLETKQGSANGASADGNGGNAFGDSKGIAYDVQIHTDEKGLEVVRQTAESGDEAAQKALAAKNYRGASVRGVTPATDPDPNSLGGERDAAIMYANAENFGDAGVNPMGTEANVEATEKLGKADVTELGE
jgi:hypothetical protein